MHCLAGLRAPLFWYAPKSPWRALFRALLQGPLGDRAVLLATFFLTVAFDLTLAIQGGVVLASVAFMQRMSDVVAIVAAGRGIIEDDSEDEDADRPNGADQRELLPPHVQAFQLGGPLFFGVASRIGELMGRTGGARKCSSCA